jgi:hypothetical protein
MLPAEGEYLLHEISGASSLGICSGFAAAFWANVLPGQFDVANDGSEDVVEIIKCHWQAFRWPPSSLAQLLFQFSILSDVTRDCDHASWPSI